MRDEISESFDLYSGNLSLNFQEDNKNHAMAKFGNHKLLFIVH